MHCTRLKAHDVIEGRNYVYTICHVVNPLNICFPPFCDSCFYHINSYHFRFLRE